MQKLHTDVVKYIVIGVIILTLIVFIPYNKLGVKDALILTIILTLVVAIIETTTNMLSNKSDTTTETFETSMPPIVVSTPIAPPPQQPIQNTTQPQTNDNVPLIPTELKNCPMNDLYNRAPNCQDKEADGSRTADDVNMSDLPYTDYHHLPLGDTYQTGDFEYGYSFLPPEKWYPTPPFPPVCVSEKRCPVCPTFTIGTPVDVKEWNTSRKITPPAGINTQYIKDTLNAGK